MDAETPKVGPEPEADFVRETRVSSIYSAVKASHLTTLRASVYLEKRQKLAEFDRYRLRHLEEEFFHSGINATCCADDIAPKPFHGSGGKIIYAFSRSEMKFVLTDFTLSRGDWGGHPNTFLPANIDSRYRVHSFVPDSAEDKIAACSRARFAAPAYDAGWSFHYLHSLLGKLLTFLPELFLFSRVGSGKSSIIGNVTRLSGRLTVRDSVPSAWAAFVSRGAVTGHRDDLYMRSIVTGELLCHFASKMQIVDGNHRLPVYRRLFVRGISNSDLLRSCMRVFESGGGSIFNDGAPDAFITSCLTNKHLFEDDCLLALVRSELTMRLSRAVWDEVNGITSTSHAGIDANSDASQARAAVAIRKFALLTEYAGLSGRYFGGGVDYYPTLKNVLACIQSGDRLLIRSAPVLFDFDQCTKALLAQIEMDVDEGGRAGHDMGVLKDRLVNLVREILTPSLPAAQKSFQD